MSVYYNLGSIFLGLAAWVLPLVGLGVRRRVKIASAFSMASFSAALASLVLQFFEIRHRVGIGDFSAVMDTIDVLAGVVVILVSVTVLLNTAALWAMKERAA